MSRITPVSAKKRKIDEAMRGKTSKPRKRIRKQRNYHSSSSEDEAASDQDVGFAPVNLGDSDGEEAQVVEPAAGKKRKTQKKQIASDAPVELKAEASRKRVEDDDNEADGGSSSEEVATSNVELVGPQEDTTSASHHQSSSNEDDETASDDQSSASETSSTTNPNHTKPRTKSKRNPLLLLLPTYKFEEAFLTHLPHLPLPLPDPHRSHLPLLPPRLLSPLVRPSERIEQLDHTPRRNFPQLLLLLRYFTRDPPLNAQHICCAAFLQCGAFLRPEFGGCARFKAKIGGVGAGLCGRGAAGEDWVGALGGGEFGGEDFGDGG